MQYSGTGRCRELGRGAAVAGAAEFPRATSADHCSYLDDNLASDSLRLHLFEKQTLHVGRACAQMTWTNSKVVLAIAVMRFEL